MATAGIQTTLPLALGLLLENGSYLLVGGAGSVPITAKNGDLLYSSSGADIATTVPLILGIQLATEGATAYTLTAATGNVPITAQNANVSTSIDTCDALLTVPLALGFLLTDPSYTLVAGGSTIVLNFAPADSSSTSVADPPPPGGGKRQTVVMHRGKPDSVRQRELERERDERDVFDIIMAIAHQGTTCLH
jgi:hypothetical protein